jgi:thymidylate synthase (FAD)
MRHWHTTPFEMAELKFRVRVPMDTWRQWIRHRTASVNEYSTRYSVAIDEFATTSPEAWRLQAESNRQGSAGLFYPEDGAELSATEASFHALARNLYETRLDKGVAREQARKDLPLSNYTEAYWKVDLHNLFHFLRLRMDSHAQQEIRGYAEIIGREIVAKLFPLAWEAFVDYRLESLQLTKLEIGVVQRMMVASQVNRTRTLLQNFEEAQDPSWKTLKKCRERDECLEKLEILGVFPNGSAKS